VVALMRSDFLINIAGMPYQKRGTHAWRKHAAILFAAFPDLQVKIEDIFGAEDKVSARLRISGTHAGEFLGIQPTGKRVEYESTEVYRIADLRHADPDGPDQRSGPLYGQARLNVACGLPDVVRVRPGHSPWRANRGVAPAILLLGLNRIAPPDGVHPGFVNRRAAVNSHLTSAPLKHFELTLPGSRVDFAVLAHCRGAQRDRCAVGPSCCVLGVREEIPPVSTSIRRAKTVGYQPKQ